MPEDKLTAKALTPAKATPEAGTVSSGQSEGVEVMPYSEEDFYRNITEKEINIASSQELSDDELKAIRDNPLDREKWKKIENEQLRRLDSTKLRKYLVSRKLNNFRSLMPGSSWGARGLLLQKTGIQRIQYAEEQIKRSQKGEANTLQIIRDMDRVVIKMGYALEDVKGWAKNNYENHADDLVKIYCAMRRLGYKHYPDLLGDPND
jgi:hypothetical protein